MVIDDRLLTGAAEAQATLAPKLAELAAVHLPFPTGASHTEAEHWIASGGRVPHSGPGWQPAAAPGLTEGTGADDSRTAAEPSEGTEADGSEAAAGPSGGVGAGGSQARSAASAVLAAGDPAGWSAADLLAGFRSGRLDPVEAVEAVLARMDAVDGELHAVVARLDDRARAAAVESSRRWKAGEARPLEGMPVGVKDIIETAGAPTRAGSPLFADHVPEANAAVVDRLERAGAVVVAKTATPELAFGDETGPGVVNPWGPGRWTGGSSSGSAVALASGQFPAALGTDTGGSIRVPASYCGVSGIKPTFGRVPRTGVFPVSWSLDHVGPMARTVEDLALLLTVLAGADPADPYSSDRPVPEYVAVAGAAASAGLGGLQAESIGTGLAGPSIATTSGLGGLRVGLPEGWLAQGCSPGVMAARDEAADALADLGAEIVPVEVPHAELAGTVAWLITVVEFAANHDTRLDRLEDFTASAAHRLVAGSQASASDYVRALRARQLVQQDFDAVFERVDVVLTPATPTAAPDMATFFDDGDRLWLDKVARNFLIFNVTGMPALVMPAGTDDGLPVAVQIAAPPHRDDLCLAVGTAFQQATDHHLNTPVT